MYEFASLKDTYHSPEAECPSDLKKLVPAASGLGNQTRHSATIHSMRKNSPRLFPFTDSIEHHFKKEKQSFRIPVSNKPR